MREITPKKLIESLSEGLKNLENHENEINELNVFPVPDGDTGSNMVFTLKGGIEKVEEGRKEDIKQILKNFYEGCLYSSRGNSGIILSQFIKGIYHEVKNEKFLSIRELAKGFVRGYYYSWKAISNPVEGTILTIMRDTSKIFAKNHNKNNVFQIFKEVIECGYDSLERTPTLLPILKEAGVVDAGGKGFLHFIEGFFYKWLSQIEILKLKKEIPVTPIAVVREIVESVQTEKVYPAWFIDLFPEIQRRLKNASFPSFEIKDIRNILKNISNVWRKEIKNRYDVEVVLEPKNTEIKEIEKNLKKMGDSLIIAKNGLNLKIHIHTNDFQGIISYIEKFGEIKEKFIQDMEKQRQEFLKKKQGIVIFVQGEGFLKIFKGLGIKDVFFIQNPSYKEIEQILRNMEFNEIIVIPNDKNLCCIIKEALKKWRINYYLIENNLEAEGIYLAMEWNADENIKKIFNRMENKIKSIKAYEIKRALREKQIKGFTIKRGDYLFLKTKKIYFSSKNLKEIFKFIKQNFDFGNLLLFYGENIDEKFIKENLLDAGIEEYEIYYGGQKNSILQILMEEEI